VKASQRSKPKSKEPNKNEYAALVAEPLFDVTHVNV